MYYDLEYKDILNPDGPDMTPEEAEKETKKKMKAFHKKEKNPLNPPHHNRKHFLLERNLINNEIDCYTRKGLKIKLFKDGFSLAMRNMKGEYLGEQKRFYKKKGKYKSMTVEGGKVGYFYDKPFDQNKDTIITEGEIDFITLVELEIYYNVIGLQGIQNLSKLIKEIQELKYNKDIYLIVDNDDAANKAISKLINSPDLDISNIYDARGAISPHKDANDAWRAKPQARVTPKSIYEHCKSLKGNTEVILDRDKLIIVSKEGSDKLNHNNIAKYIVEKCNLRASNENVFRWDGKIWKSINKSLVMQIILSLLEEELGVTNVKTRDKNAIYEFVLIICEDTKLQKALMGAKKDEYKIYLSDGVYDIRMKAKREYRLNDYAMSMIPYSSSSIRNNKEPKRSLHFLRQILEGYEDIDGIIQFLREWIGYLFIPSTRLEKALLIHGDGCNGKGVLCKIISNLLGDNISNVGLHQLIREQNLLLLLGSLLNLDEDMSHGAHLDSGIFKSLVSGEAVIAKPLYKQPLRIVPYTRFLICTNHLPDVRHIDKSISRRIVPIHLKVSFKGREDPTLKDKLYEEKEEFFSRCVAGLSTLLDRGGFNVPKELETELQNYLDESDPVKLFIESDFISAEEGVGKTKKIKYSDLYKLFNKFCQAEGFRNKIGNRQLIARLVSMGYERTRNGSGRYLKGLYDDGHSRMYTEKT